jgi:hypothetical protein
MVVHVRRLLRRHACLPACCAHLPRVPCLLLLLPPLPAAVPGQEPDMSWRIRDGEGRLNWGLISFLALASACVAVWGALLAQYAVYRRWVGTGGVLAGCLFAGRAGCGWEGG